MSQTLDDPDSIPIAIGIAKNFKALFLRIPRTIELPATFFSALHRTSYTPLKTPLALAGFLAQQTTAKKIIRSLKADLTQASNKGQFSFTHPILFLQKLFTPYQRHVHVNQPLRT